MIRGEKTILRPWDVADAERITRWLNDDEVTRFLPLWFPVTQKQEEAWIGSEIPGETRFAIDTLGGRHIGHCSLKEEPGHARCSEVGLWIGERECWGRGYCTDALISLCMFGFVHRNLHRIFLHVVADNLGAVRCYEKAGFTHEGRLREHRYHEGRYWDVLCMGLLREEFRGRFPERWPEA
jgi:RimJ/RimL family protein N-acetyltransferase